MPAQGTHLRSGPGARHLHGAKCISFEMELLRLSGGHCILKILLWGGGGVLYSIKGRQGKTERIKAGKLLVGLFSSQQQREAESKK